MAVLPSHNVDVLIVTAVKDECDGVLQLEKDWSEHLDSSGFRYYVRKDADGLSWTLARAVDMGPEHAANLATRLVAILQPRCLAMIGVCAGQREKVLLGDVIVAERLFRYDAGKLRAFREGATRVEEVFQDIRTYNLDSRWRQHAEDFTSSWSKVVETPRPLGVRSQEIWLLNVLSESESGVCPPPRDHPERKHRCPDWTVILGRLEKRTLVTLDGGLRLTENGRKYVEELRDRFPDGYPSERNYPKVHVAPMATGSRVVEDEELFPTIQRYLRKTLSIDMEGSAVAAVAEIEGVDHCLVVKAVQDHADPDKDDRFRDYSIEASYRFLVAFLRSELGPPKKRSPFIVPQHETPTFTGRDEELKSLETILLGDRVGRVCTIAGLSGTGGIGKSALAVHFALLYRDHFPDGVIGVRVDGKDVDTIAREFARNIGEIIEPDDERDASGIMQSLFNDRDALLIFDNAEDPALRRVIPAGRCKVIITTRDRGLPVLLEVQEGERIDVPALPMERSLELLRKRLGERVDADLGAARRIVTAVGGLPLALQIIAATLEIEPWRVLAEFATFLEQERHRLTKLAVRGDPHLDVRVSFSASLKLLRPEEIDFFGCLSICDADSFALHSATAATGCEAADASERLGYLYRISLVNRPDSADSSRFVLHPLLRQFSREIAEERGIYEIAAERHARHFIAFVKEGTRLSNVVTDDIGEMLIAARWLLHKEEADYQYLICLEPLMQRYGYWKEAENLMKDFLKLAEKNADSGALIQLNIQLAKFQQLRGDFQQSHDGLNRSLALVEGLEDKRGQAMVLNSLGGVLQRLGRFEEAADVLAKAGSIEDELGNKRGQAMVLNSLGGVLQRLGRFEEAADALQRSYDLLVDQKDERGQAMVLNSLGGVLQRLGRFEEAADALQRSMAISEELKDQRSLAMVLNSLGGVLQRLGRFEEAADALQRSMAIS
ncbi:MAG: tetratricopeptide repeat protein, partial [Nitrospirota bacterium]